MKASYPQVEGAREPWRLIPIFGVTQLVNTVLYLFLAVVPFYSLAAGSPAGQDAANYAPFTAGALGSLMLAGAGFAVTFGRLLSLALFAVLALLIPAGWRGLSRSERVMWVAALVVGVVVYSLTWPQSYEIQQWVLA